MALSLFLEYAARHTFHGLPRVIKADRDQTRTALKEDLKPEDGSAEKRFFAHLQMPDETVAIYATALRHLGNLAFMEHNVVTRDKLLVKQFLRGLDSQVAEVTALRNTSRLGDAISAAQEALKVQKIRKVMQSDTSSQFVALLIVVRSPEYISNSCAAQRDVL